MLRALFAFDGNRPTLSTGQSLSTSTLPAVPTYDVTEFAAEIDLSSLDVITWTPAWMSRAERLMLFSLIFSLRPQRYLEIGTFQGGSALIVSSALDELGTDAYMYCVDPNPRMADDNWDRIKHRANLFKGYSPQILQKVYDAAGAPFDFVFIDGDHSYEGVMRDARGVMPYVKAGTYLLFHDSFFPDVQRGLQDFAEEYRDCLVDIGPITREVTVQQESDQTPQSWGGLHLMHVRRR